VNGALEGTFQADTEADMLALGVRLAAGLEPGEVIGLSGDLGVGKTTLARGMLRGLGFDGRVKSPSYGLVESYKAGGLVVHHLDLYRLGAPEELDFIGLEDLLEPGSVLLIEWPERGRGRLPPASRGIRIAEVGGVRTITVAKASRTDAGNAP